MRDVVAEVTTTLIPQLPVLEAMDRWRAGIFSAGKLDEGRDPKVRTIWKDVETGGTRGLGRQRGTGEGK